VSEQLRLLSRTVCKTIIDGNRLTADVATLGIVIARHAPQLSTLESPKPLISELTYSARDGATFKLTPSGQMPSVDTRKLGSIASRAYYHRSLTHPVNPYIDEVEVQMVSNAYGLAFADINGANDLSMDELGISSIAVEIPLETGLITSEQEHLYRHTSSRHSIEQLHAQV
jgi:hypothetical protein